MGMEDGDGGDISDENSFFQSIFCIPGLTVIIIDIFGALMILLDISL